MDINFQQLMAEAGEGFQPIPPGPYTVECEKAEPTTSTSQKPQIKVTLRVLGGDHNGRKLFDQFTLTAGNPAALGFFFDNMAAFGLDRSFFAGLGQMANPMAYVAQMLLGRQANISVKMDTYQGVERNKVAQYRPIAGGNAPVGAPPQQGVPAFPQAPGNGTMPVAPAPQYAPQAPAPMPPGVPQVPQPQVPPVQEQPAPWQQQPQPQQFMPQEQAPPTYQQPVAPGEQQAQPSAAPMWQPSAAPPGYVDPNQPQQAPQPQSGPPPEYPQPPQPPQGVPPMPGRSI